MNSFALILVLGSLGAFAKPQSNAFCAGSNGFNGAYGSSLPVMNTHIQTSAVENPTVNFPSYVPPTTISESCHCFNTLVRPQIRNEMITVPTIDRIVRTVSSPIIETINCGGGTRLATFTDANNLLSAVVGSLSKVSNTGNAQNTNSAGVNVGLFARPTFYTIQGNSGRNVGRVNGYQDSSVIKK